MSSPAAAPTISQIVRISAGRSTSPSQDSADDQAVFGQNNLNGNDSVLARDQRQRAALTLFIDGVEFQGARSDLLDDGASARRRRTSRSAIAPSTMPTPTSFRRRRRHADRRRRRGRHHVDYLVDGNSFTRRRGHALERRLQPGWSGDDPGPDRGQCRRPQRRHRRGRGIVDGNGISVGLEQSRGDRRRHLRGRRSSTTQIYDVAQGLGGIVHRMAGGGTAEPARSWKRWSTATPSPNWATSRFAALYALVGGSRRQRRLPAARPDLSDNVFDASDADFGGNAVIFDQVLDRRPLLFPGLCRDRPMASSSGGTASADLDAFLSRTATS